MLFSSSVFIFIFLPAVLAVYYLLLRKSRKLQNIFLALASLFFYAWGEPKFVLIMLASIVMNWLFGLLVDRQRGKSAAKLSVALAVIYNLAVLFIFKYLNFTVDNINALFGASVSVREIALPIGISFFTFQAMSYVIDVYRGDGQAQKNIINVGLYISFFPQLIAGPIVRYNTVADQIENRRETAEDFFEGFTRFVIGLAKKVMLANSLAIIADRAFDGFEAGGSLSTLGAWLGAVCYTMQIFYDFSGYSDMAIGLGRMFGFHFLENFNYPYMSSSVTEFWRRWHMSLGTWFRDYVYISLGGSRVSKPRLVFNLFVVWLLTGVWHGANWTFIAWGLMYFVLLVTEKLTGFYKTDKKAAKPFLWLYTILFVVLGWVLFRSSTITDALNYITLMFGRGGVPADAAFLAELRQAALFLAFGILFSFPVIPKLKEKLKENIVTDILFIIAVTALFVLSAASIVSSSYNPFIYFNF
jgi:D-alanyl-lipoteichoic acid acyltransferase DltB (MBOAT superfamily)